MAKEKIREVRKGDFIRIDYTGKLEDGAVFDTTDEELAKKAGLHRQGAMYGPVTIRLGEGHVLKGLDEALEGAVVGTHTVVLPPEKAFGKKDARLIQLVATQKFKKQKINPMPGLQVNVDGTMGVIKNVSGGRTLVDFNHPLSGRKVAYDVTIHEVVEDAAKQVEAVVDLALGQNASVEYDAGAATVTSRIPLPDTMKAELKNRIVEQVKDVKSVKFQVEKRGQADSGQQK
ncbi:MAG: FKBP-type peptidyl-prolyl cis-trans isomerase [Nanoarchaeota archaeon]